MNTLTPLDPMGPPFNVAILLLDQFAMIAFSSTVEPLREANWIAGWKAYDWTVLSHDGKPVRASNGLALQVDGSIKDVPTPSMVIVCSSFDPHLHVTPGILSWLRRLDRTGAMVGCVETGAYVLALAGLLDGYRATVHWENIDGLKAEFPDVTITGQIYEIDRRRFSASGAAAAMDLMLHFIAIQLGRPVAARIAEEFIYNRIRKADAPQRLEAHERLSTRQPRLRRILRRLEASLAERLDIADVAAAEGISERELRRLFRHHLGVSPQAFHRRLRLEKARSLLHQTDISILDIALTCGFASGSDFSRAFRREFQQTPADDRRSASMSDRSAGSLQTLA